MELGAIAVSADSLTMDEPPMLAATHGFASRAAALLPHDPRILQIAFLGALLAAGAYLRDFSLRPAQIALTFAAALTIQRLLDRLTRKPAPSLLSATITSLSLTLLLRADNLWALPAAAVFAIASKFMLRVRGKHLFNPANFGVGAALLVLPGTWISPGQWGNDVALAGWLVVLGATVASRARRADISWMFLVFYLGALAARVAWLGQRWAVWTHQLSSGALLLFAFFMISDPMTTPSHIKGRAAHAALVAAIAYAWGFGLFRTNAVLWALFVAAPMVAVWDWLWPAPKFDWTSVQGSINGQGGINGIEDIENIGIEAHPQIGRGCRRAKRALSLMLALGALTAAILASWPPAEARAFCGFYVGRADARLYNHASQVVMVRDGDRTVLSLMNDYQGEPEEFALVIPVPVVLQQGQIHIGNRELFQRIDSYSAPRLVEYYDPSPCPLPMSEMRFGSWYAGCGASQCVCRARADAGEGARRDGRSAIHGRRVRHRDSLGHAIRRARDLARANRLPHSRGSRRRACALYPSGDEVFRRAGQSQGASAHRAQLSAADPVRFRIAQVHAADSPGDD